jgi:hypothetical protein
MEFVFFYINIDVKIRSSQLPSSVSDTKLQPVSGLPAPQSGDESS